MTVPPKPTDPNHIELLDASHVSTVSHGAADVVSSHQPRARSIGLGLAAVAIVGAGFAALASDEAAISPSTSTPPTSAEAPPTPTTSGLNSTITVGETTAIIGDGPQLAWERVGGPVPGSTDFEWIDGAFVSSDVVTVWSISPAGEGLEVTQRPSAIPDPNGRTSIDAVGATAWLRADGSIDVLAGNSLTTIEPDTISALDTDLGRLVASYRVAVHNETIVLVQTTGFLINDDALLSRLDEPTSPVGTIIDLMVSEQQLHIYGPLGSSSYAIDDVNLTDQELGWLRLTDQLAIDAHVFNAEGSSLTSTTIGEGPVAAIAVIDETFVVSTFQNTHRSLDGQSWGTTAMQQDVQVSTISPGLDGGIHGNDYRSFEPRFARSLDLGITWAFTPQPMRSPVFQTGLGTLVVSSGWVDQSTELGRWGATESGFTLKITDMFGQFELVGPDGASLDSGAVTDQNSGFEFWPGPLSYRYIDPDTGTELVHFDGSDLLRGYAAIVSNAGEPMMIGVADWADPDVDPVWTLETVEEAFGTGALSASFVAGEDQLLAIVETNGGRRYFVTSAP